VIPVGDQAEGAVADPVTHLVAVGVRNPAGLALVDGRSGQALGRLPLPGTLRHLQLAAPGGPVLVPDEDSGALITVALPAGTVLARVPIGRLPHHATATADGTIAVADELGKALVLVRDGQVMHRFTDLAQLHRPGPARRPRRRRQSGRCGRRARPHPRRLRPGAADPYRPRRRR